MHLTTETAVTAIAQVQAAYNCSDLDAITRMQGAAVKAGDEASLEVLCAIKAVLIAQEVGPFKMQNQTSDGIWKESGALMNFDSGDWEPTVFATKAEGFAAAAKHWGCSADDLALFCRAVVVGSADDLDAVIRQKVKNAKCLNKNANAVARHGFDSHLKEAARLRAKRDACMAVAREAKTKLAALTSVKRADYTHCTGCNGTGLDQRDGFTSCVPCIGQGGLYIEPVAKAAPAAPVMNGFRNLYKVADYQGALLAHVTAASHEKAVEAYRAAAGGTDVVTTEQLSHGYPEDVCTIYS